jgi:hypothetical protein
MSQGKQWVVKRGSAASVLIAAGSIAQPQFTAAAVSGRNTYRVQRADFAYSRPSRRNVLERSAYRGDVSGVDGL